MYRPTSNRYTTTMTYQEYAEKARSVAFHTVPDNDYKAIHVAMYNSLGLANEYAEFIESVHELKRDVHNSIIHMYNEAGDVLWYTFNLLLDFDIDIIQQVYENDSSADISIDHASNMINKHIGTICGIVKKLWRDNPMDNISLFPITINDNIKNDLSESLYSIIMFIGVILTDIMANDRTIDQHINRTMCCNIDKLFSRRDRGVLCGSGDYR